MRVEIASSLRSRLVGLLGRDALDGALMLAPCNDIHTFGMRRSIDVAFIGADGTVLESFRNVGANRRLRSRRAVATLERFAAHGDWLEPGDVLAWSFERPSTASVRGPLRCRR